MKSRLLLFSFLMLGTFFVSAQEVTVTGNVTSAADNLPLPGVNVIVSGTSRGTNTDFDGNYEIAVSSGETIQFSSIGFKTKSIVINNQTVLNVALEEDAESLDEVVVVGFGTQRRSEVTGAITSIKSEEILKQPFANATQAVQGKLAGVNIVNSDAPGASPQVIIRGIGTASGQDEPLYVVDGTLVNGITNINPADIETIDILKDASSAAIYGMDAANGVVIITTKKGRKGTMKVSLSSFYGAKSVLNQVEMADAQQYITYFNENQSFLPEDTRFFLADASQQTYDTDWYDVITDVGFTNSNNVAFSGASENINYFFSYNNYNEDGILENQDFSRNTLRSNTIFNFFDNRVKFTSNVSAAFTKSTPKPFGAFNDAYRQSPLVPEFYPNGRFGDNIVNRTTGIAGFDFGPGEVSDDLNSIGNPSANVFFTNQKNLTTDLQGNFELEVKLTDYLRVTSRVGLTKTYGRFRNFNDIRGRFILTGDPTTRTEEFFNELKEQNPENVQYANNSISYTTNESTRYNWDTYLNFDKVFAEKHTISALAGIVKSRRDDFFTSSVTGFEVPSQEQYWSINFANSGTYPNTASQGFSTPTNQLSYLGRIQYSFEDKYQAQVNFRRDGVSTFRNSFGDGNQETSEYFGNFPSFSLGWTLTEENFLNDVSWLNFLKLRGGWGKLGNSRVPFNVFTFNTTDGSRGGNNVNYVFGVNQDLVLGAALGAPVFPISWEVTNETNIGLDFRMFNSKLTGDLNFYDRNTENAILLVQPLLNSPADNSFFDEGAEVTNRGIEVELNWRDDISQNFSYNIGVTYSYNKNNVENVVPAYDGQVGGSLNNGEITKRLQEGQPLYAWWMWETEGVWQTQEEIDNNASFGSPSPGHLRYKDQNNDGVIDDRDKVFHGSYLPTYNFGVSLGFRYKSLDFSLDGFGAGGNKVYNGLKGTRIDGGENVTADVFNERWTGPGSTNSNPGANRDSRASDYYLEDGDFFRINNMTLGYTLTDVVDEISSIRIYASAQNPFLFTKYSGFTPEIIGNAGASPQGSAGIELSAYPNTRTFLFGVNIEL